MTTTRRASQTIRYLSREQQFCRLCHAAGRGWVRVSNVADMVELRRGRSERAAQEAYRKRRWRALVRHLAACHPEARR